VPELGGATDPRSIRTKATTNVLQTEAYAVIDPASDTIGKYRPEALRKLEDFYPPETLANTPPSGKKRGGRPLIGLVIGIELDSLGLFNRQLISFCSKPYQSDENGSSTKMPPVVAPEGS
jgi:hypothetical protein